MSLNKLQMERVNQYLANNHLFQQIVENYVKEQNLTSLVKMLETSHSSNRSLLMDLGVVFKEMDTIRTLNEEVRRLENEKGSRELDFSDIGTFLNVKQEKFSEHLKNYGISGSIGLNMTSSLNVDIKFFSQHLKPFSKLKDFRSEDEFNKYMAKHQLEYNTFIEGFDTVESDNSDLYLDNTDRNISKLKIIIEEFFQAELSNFKYKIGWTVCKETDEVTSKTKKQILRLSEISFCVLVTSRDRSINAVFNNR